MRPGGPTNWPAWRASAAALRGGGANSQRARPLPLWRERPGYWLRRAVSLSCGAGGSCPPGVVVVRKPAWPKRSAGLAGFPFYGELYFVKSGPAAGCCHLYRFSGEGGSSRQRRAVSSDHNVWSGFQLRYILSWLREETPRQRDLIRCKPFILQDVLTIFFGHYKPRW